MGSALDSWAASGALTHPLLGHLVLGTFIRPAQSARQEMSSGFLCPNPQPDTLAPARLGEVRKARNHPPKNGQYAPNSTPPLSAHPLTAPGLRGTEG